MPFQGFQTPSTTHPPSPLKKGEILLNRLDFGDFMKSR